MAADSVLALLRVEPGDLTLGIPKSGCFCAVALAFNRLLGREFSAIVVPEFSTIRPSLLDRNDRWLVSHPEELREYIRDYDLDGWRGVRPAQFGVWVPRDLWERTGRR